MSVRISDREIETAVAALRQSKSVVDAIGILGRAGVVVTSDGLYAAFRRRGIGTPTAHLDGGKGKTWPERSHVAKHGSAWGGVAGSAVAPSVYAGSVKAADNRLDPAKYAGIADDPAPDVARILDDSAAQRKARQLRAEHAEMVERLREANARASFLEAIGERPPPRIVAHEQTSGLREATAIALLSDCHVEETVDPVQVAGLNEYNLDISAVRMTRFFVGVRRLIELERNAFEIRECVLWVGGDVISGYIHDELAETNALSPVEAVLFAKGMLSNGIASLLADGTLTRLVVVCSHGNHGRTTEKRRVQTGAENSFEWLMYNVLRDEWKHEPRVEFVVDRSAHQYVEVYGQNLHFTHGDELKYGGGVGGLTIPLMKRIPSWDRVRRSAVHNLGHFHTYMPLRRAVVNGSLIGYSPYSMSIGADPEPPQQAFYTFDSKRGKCRDTAVWVDEDAA